LNGLDSGFPAAAIVSVLAVACLDYFFIEPVFTWTVSDPVDIAALVSFWITSLVVTRHAARAREKTTTAQRERRKMERLYELAQRLLALEPLGTQRSKVLETFYVVLQLEAVCIFDANTAELTIVGDSRANLGPRTRDAYILGKDFDESSAKVAVRCLGIAGNKLGAIGFEGLDDPQFTATPLAALAMSVLERERSVRSAANAAAEAHREVLRSAILDALAHEFKTPLATILTAAGGLRAVGPLLDEQTELAELVETEAERLSNLSSRLLRLARLDRDEVKLRLQPVDLALAVDSVVDRYCRQFPDRVFSFFNHAEPHETLADIELFQLALSQLLEMLASIRKPDQPSKSAWKATRTRLR
jgi:two-component system sensor histidine kinase KdpD